MLLEHALNMGLEITLTTAVHVHHHLAHFTQRQRLGRQVRYLQIIHIFNFLNVTFVELLFISKIVADSYITLEVFNRFRKFVTQKTTPPLNFSFFVKFRQMNQKICVKITTLFISRGPDTKLVGHWIMVL